MKKIIAKLSEVFVPISLCLALIVTAVMSMNLIENLQGNARVINHIGIVRGATQRLIKKELQHEEDDKLIQRLDAILDGLSNGCDDLSLIKLNDEQFQALLVEMKEDWTSIKSEIYNYRQGSSSNHLYALSEKYFDLADKTVFKAEEYTEQQVQHTRGFLIFMNVIFILMAIGCTIFTFYQEKRRKKLIKAEEENIKKSEMLAKQAQALQAPMDEISEMMYVSDLKTYDLLFVNETGKKIFHIDMNKPHQKCYKVIQGLDEPCSFCTNKCLKMNETYSWEYTNPLLNRHYLLKDRLIEWDGRSARMEIAFDITENNNEKKELMERLKRDEIRLDCVRELYNNRDTDLAINRVLALIGELFSAERAYVFKFHGEYYSNIAEWCKEGVTPEIDNLQNIPLDDYKEWLEELEKNKKVIINDVEELKDTVPLGYELLSKQNIRNLVWVPLIKDGKVIGSFGLDNQDLDLAEIAIPFLQTVQYFLTLTMQRNENEKKLYEMSQIDKLTSFFNRNRFIHDLAKFEKHKEPFGVIYLDVNGLKEINDSFGHDAGDQLIKECADIMSSRHLSKYLYRIGGDEFVIIFMNITEEGFQDCVQLLKNDFKESRCRIALGSKWNEDSSKIQNVIKEADKLMYADKKRFYQGHHVSSRYRYHDDILKQLADPEVLIKHIQERRFKVYLQSKIDLDSEKLAGAEALVRYQDEDGEIILPDKFISILEDAYSISKIDYFVFEEVCKKLSTWIGKGYEEVTISSNFSRVTFMEDGFVKRIEAICDHYQINRSLLEIEITESVDYVDLDTLIEKINEIRNAGFKVAVDDFGVESSNLKLLSLVKLDVLKIDKGFVKDIEENKNAQIIIGNIARMCKEMNIQLVVEGIENEQQLEILKKYDVKRVQGFLFSKPVSYSVFEEKYIK